MTKRAIMCSEESNPFWFVNNFSPLSRRHKDRMQIVYSIFSIADDGLKDRQEAIFPFSRALILLFMAASMLLALGIGVHADEFKLIESFPVDGQTISMEDFTAGDVHLVFNNPLDEDTIGLINIIQLDDPSTCQLNICGCVMLVHDNTKLIWHPGKNFFRESTKFRIELGSNSNGIAPGIYGIKDIFGNEMEVTTIDFEIDPCDPLVRETWVNGAKCRLCLGDWHCFERSVTIGDVIQGTATIFNPICAGFRSIEVKTWLELPDERRLSVKDPYATIEMSPGETLSGELFKYTFTGAEVLGGYTFVVTLIDPITGKTYSSRSDSFSFRKCNGR